MQETLAAGLMCGAPPFPEHAQVTLANWQDPPYNRWSFQHVRELIPTVRIRPSGDPSPLPRAESDILDLEFRSADRTLRVQDMLDETYTDGFAVLHRGRLLAEQYSNGMAADTPHLLMSVSKSVTAAVAGILVHSGRLAPERAVTDLVPELRGSSFEGATVQHLLDMRAGTRFNEDYDDLDSDVRTYESVYLWRPGDGPRPADALEYFTTLANDSEHGGPFRYRSILTDVLSWVLERASGTRFADLVSEEVWRPMGAEHDAEVTVDGHGNPMADGGICATLRDLLRFGALYQCSDGNGVLPAEWIADTARGAADGAEAFAAGEPHPGFPPGAHYRNCWWVRDPQLPLLMAVGIYGQSIHVHQPADLVVAKFSTWPTPLSQQLSQLTTDAVLAIAAALS